MIELPWFLFRPEIKVAILLHDCDNTRRRGGYRGRMKTTPSFRHIHSIGSSTAIGTRIWSRLYLVTMLSIVFGLGSASVLGSDPVGIYAWVEKVIFEPSESAPERVQIWGAFAHADRGGYQYAPAKRGIMYFQLKQDEADICRREWKDMKSVAGTDQIIAFGQRYAPKGTIYPTTGKLSKPDVYPVGFGLTKISKRAKDDYGPIKDLRALQSEREKTKPSS